MVKRRGFFWKLLAGNLLVIAALAAVGGLVSYAYLNRGYQRQSEAAQDQMTRAMQRHFESLRPKSPAEVDTECKRHQYLAPMRLTVIAPDGDVLGDSEADEASMLPHKTPDRPEVLAALLEAGKWMFQRASDALLTRADPVELCDELYEKDRQINAFEQNVRERIVTHLSLGHQVDVSTCLILMSVAKDAERIGDYAKNIFEIGRFYRRDLDHPQFVRPLAEIRTDLVPMFDQVRQAFIEGESDIARDALERTGRTTKKCDLLIHQLLRVHGTMDCDEAVAYVLMARFYKRVAAHLGNIATSVISPEAMLDYRPPASC